MPDNTPALVQISSQDFEHRREDQWFDFYNQQFGVDIFSLTDFFELSGGFEPEVRPLLQTPPSPTYIQYVAMGTAGNVPHFKARAWKDDMQRILKMLAEKRMRGFKEDMLYYQPRFESQIETQKRLVREQKALEDAAQTKLISDYNREAEQKNISFWEKAGFGGWRTELVKASAEILIAPTAGPPTTPQAQSSPQVYDPGYVTAQEEADKVIRAEMREVNAARAAVEAQKLTRPRTFWEKFSTVLQNLSAGFRLGG